MNTLLVLVFALGTAIVLINIHYSAICTLLYRLREGQWPPVIPIGIPMAGSTLLLAVILVAPSGSALAVSAALLALLDTGGPLFMLALMRNRRRQRVPCGAILR